MSRPEQTLADLFAAEHANPAVQILVDRDVTRKVVAKLKSARSHRFVFDTPASERYAEVVRDLPELLAQHQKFAKAPYETTWIEYDFRTFYRVRNANVPAHMVDVNDPTGDHRMGYLIDRGEVYVVSSGFHKHGGKRGEVDPSNETTVLLPFYYQLHTEWPVQEQLDFCARVGTSRAQLDYFFWGGTYFERTTKTFTTIEDIYKTNISDAWLRSLRANHAVQIMPLTAAAMKAGVEKNMIDVVGGGCGELRNIIAALLILSRPSLVRYIRENGRSRHFVKGKMRPYMSHTVVTIPVDLRPIVQKVYTQHDPRNSPRRHEVRGTYCHDNTARKASRLGCPHEWVDEPNARRDSLGNVAQWQCKYCHGKRWWRDAHVRGDAEIGYVNKEYSVEG